MNFFLSQYIVALNYTSRLMGILFWTFVGCGAVIIVCMIICWIDSKDIDKW